MKNVHLFSTNSIVLKVKEGKGRRTSPGSLPTHQRHYNWLEDMSISLALLVMSEVM